MLHRSRALEGLRGILNRTAAAIDFGEVSPCGSGWFRLNHGEKDQLCVLQTLSLDQAVSQFVGDVRVAGRDLVSGF